jgi:hypothetical protein
MRTAVLVAGAVLVAAGLPACWPHDEEPPAGRTVPATLAERADDKPASAAKPEKPKKPKKPPAGRAPAGWLLDYPQAKALAKQTGRPLFVVFH